MSSMCPTFCCLQDRSSVLLSRSLISAPFPMRILTILMLPEEQAWNRGICSFLVLALASAPASAGTLARSTERPPLFPDSIMQRCPIVDASQHDIHPVNGQNRPGD